MPSKRTTRGPISQQYPWVARVQLEGITYWLGRHATRMDAEIVEEEFKLDLVIITREAHRMWRESFNFQMSVARVRENANAS